MTVILMKGKKRDVVSVDNRVVTFANGETMRVRAQAQADIEKARAAARKVTPKKSPSERVEAKTPVPNAPPKRRTRKKAK